MNNKNYSLDKIIEAARILYNENLSLDDYKEYVYTDLDSVIRASLLSGILKDKENTEEWIFLKEVYKRIHG